MGNSGDDGAKRRGRLVFDVSTMARWQGPPSGIDRLQSSLVNAAARIRPSIRTAIFDPRARRYRAVDPGALDLVANPRVVVATRESSDSLRWLHGWRRPSRIASARSALLSGQYGWGERPPLHVPLSWVARRFLAFAPDDVLVDTGAGWEYRISEIVRDLKSEHRVRYITLCHDIIPLMFPQWCGAAHVETFRAHLHGQLHVADAMLFHSRRVASDVEAYAAAQGLGVRESRFVPVGIDRFSGDPAVALPPPLVMGRYVLAVGTVEPRKGHGLLLDAWRRLQVRGVPAQHGMALVFAGKPGWLADDLAAEIRKRQAQDSSVVWLPTVDDALLDRLYRDAAFCVFPSLYEGYGLPAAEALTYGRALIASTAGALPEVAGAFSICLDPADTAAWTEALARWIGDPATLHAAEARVRTGFTRTTWDQAAAIWLSVLDGLT